jgi:hypothetical protein
MGEWSAFWEIMSTAAVTFTIPDLVSQAAKVMEAVHRLGSVDLRLEDGETLVLKAKSVKPTVAEFEARFEARRKRLREMGYEPVKMTPEMEDRFSKIIAGEL